MPLYKPLCFHSNKQTVINLVCLSVRTRRIILLDHSLKHVTPPAELISTTQAKVLIEVQGGKYDLNHVENPPQGGLTDAEKQAYLEEKRSQN
ncbi:unnamed protein product [Adineta ricciae]|uniref:Uncharacterized protein n=1 Tax=Adineta ricciae TaxID=249248 RepID=A0A814ZRZ6_ADIRI|nr:unnamed protein product [Adineta ricciae]